MRLEAILWTLILLFYVVVGAAYLLIGGSTEGVVLLLAAAALGGLIAGWTWDWSRNHGERMEDRADTDASDMTGIVGVYPTASLRPLALALGMTATLLGVALGSWLSMIGVAIIASQVLLLTHDTDT